jgi:hypothetical protein
VKKQKALSPLKLQQRAAYLARKQAAGDAKSKLAALEKGTTPAHQTAKQALQRLRARAARLPERNQAAAKEEISRAEFALAESFAVAAPTSSGVDEGLEKVTELVRRYEQSERDRKAYEETHEDDDGEPPAPIDPTTAPGGMAGVSVVLREFEPLTEAKGRENGDKYGTNQVSNGVTELAALLAKVDDTILDAEAKASGMIEEDSVRLDNQADAKEGGVFNHQIQQGGHKKRPAHGTPNTSLTVVVVTWAARAVLKASGGFAAAYQRWHQMSYDACSEVRVSAPDDKPGATDTRDFAAMGAAKDTPDPRRDARRDARAERARLAKAGVLVIESAAEKKERERREQLEKNKKQKKK